MKTYALNNQTPPLAELIEETKHGEEIILTEQDRPVARLIAVSAPSRPRAKAGSLKGHPITHIFLLFKSLAYEIALMP